MIEYTPSILDIKHALRNRGGDRGRGDTRYSRNQGRSLGGRIQSVRERWGGLAQPVPAGD